VTHELARELAGISRDIRRQVGVLVDRRGSVSHVMVGDSHSIELPDWGRLRAGRGRLRGLRCIHTHLGKEQLSRDDLTDLALLRLDAMVSLAVDEDGHPGLAHIAALCPPSRGLGEATERLPRPCPPTWISTSRPGSATWKTSSPGPPVPTQSMKGSAPFSCW
jgi:GTP-binding protein HflX